MMENTEQIIPEGNIVMNDLATDNRVDDADDFFYEEPETESQISVPNIELPVVDATSNIQNDASPVVQPEMIDTMDDQKFDDNLSTALDNTFNNEEQTEVDNTIFDVEKNEEPKYDFKLSDDELKTIAKEEEETPLDDSYVLSNFDVLFDSLYSDVTGANNFISDLIEQKKNVNVNEANLNELQTKLEKERQEFAKYIEAQKQNIEIEKTQCNEYIKNQHIRLQSEEDQFSAECEATRSKLQLEEQKLAIANEKFETEKEQFAQSREIEEEKLKTDRQNFETEKEQFEKEKEIALEKIKQGQKELQTQREQFAKSKELEEKKLELESKNLSQSCARFKELVSQFNSGFQQLPGDKN